MYTFNLYILRQRQADLLSSGLHREWELRARASQKPCLQKINQKTNKKQIKQAKYKGEVQGVAYVPAEEGLSLCLQDLPSSRPATAIQGDTVSENQNQIKTTTNKRQKAKPSRESVRRRERSLALSLPSLTGLLCLSGRNHRRIH